MFLPSAYSEPFLYVVYFNSIQAITIPANKMQTRYTYSHIISYLKTKA